ncbi:hypothetical protein AAG570_003793 [Ranatra chinensis]|uniref:Uncharacterized protein n=1 Tax=Ranatra chinensis TaxID=642074 RepID=A0ABD0Y4Q3_9HEMI
MVMTLSANNKLARKALYLNQQLAITHLWKPVKNDVCHMFVNFVKSTETNYEKRLKRGFLRHSDSRVEVLRGTGHFHLDNRSLCYWNTCWAVVDLKEQFKGRDKTSEAAKVTAGGR